MKHKIASNILSLHMVKATEKILFAPLNWGLGHATRMVPLIKQELANNNEVVIAANGSAYYFLKQEFADLEFVKYPEFKIRYAAHPLFSIILLLQMPFFLISFYRDKIYLKRLIKKHGITKVISDNRYGLYSKKIKSVLITHQLFIILPKSLQFFEPFVHVITKKLIERFNECWVPDYSNINKSLSGILSHGNSIPKNVKYIEPLSRFSNYEIKLKGEKYDVVAIISGPEPQRTIFEKELTSRFKSYNGLVLFICGKPLNDEQVFEGSITKIPHATTSEMAFYISNASTIVARSGYSTIMDLHVLGAKAELIPTPGQTEQEYLAKWNK